MKETRGDEKNREEAMGGDVKTRKNGRRCSGGGLLHLFGSVQV